MANNIKITNSPVPPAGDLSRMDIYLIALGGVIGTGIITLVGPGIELTGQSAWLAYLGAIVVGFISIFPIILAASTVRVAGGVYSVIAGLSGPMLAGIMTYTNMVLAIANASMAIALRDYVADIIPSMDSVWIPVAALTLMYVINLCGIKIFSRATSIMTWILFVGLMLFMVVGLPQIDQPIFNFSSPLFFTHGAEGFVDALMLFEYSTCGYMLAIYYGAGAKRATRDIPAAMLMCIPVLIVLYCGVTIVAAGVLPVEAVAGKTLAVVAREIMGPKLYLVFILCGPVTAILVTMNTTMSSNMIPISQAARDGWFPKSFARENRRNVPWKIVTYLYLVSLIPVVLGFDITLITKNTQLIRTIMNSIMIVSIANIPKKFPEAWKRSTLHMPNWAFYVSIFAALAVNVYTIVQSLLSLTLSAAIGNSGCLIVAAAIGVIASKRFKINIVTSIWTDDGQVPQDKKEETIQ